MWYYLTWMRAETGNSNCFNSLCFECGIISKIFNILWFHSLSGIFIIPCISIAYAVFLILSQIYAFYFIQSCIFFALTMLIVWLLIIYNSLFVRKAFFIILHFSICEIHAFQPDFSYLKPTANQYNMSKNDVAVCPIFANQSPYFFRSALLRSFFCRFCLLLAFYCHFLSQHFFQTTWHILALVGCSGILLICTKQFRQIT